MIYHYCTANVFSSIISTQEVWLTDITKLNDETEYVTGFDLISEVLSARGIKKKLLRDSASEQISCTSCQILVGCFSQEGDLGSQWRLYADDGRGLCIGFDEACISRNNLFNRSTAAGFQPIKSHVALRSVEYDQAAFIRKVEDLVDTLEHNNPKIKDIMLDIGLRRYAAIYKDQFFRDEREVRAMIEIDARIDDDYELGVRKNVYNEQANYHKLLTSYRGISAIKEVLIGPLCPLSIEQVRDELASHNLSEVEVTYSSGRGRYRAAPAKA
ncbi:DUF2971 domain-containing protein [Pseudomonas sp. NPDC089395]|uniref:DUF2971 domain-containing protein n=1 Tax=unclassified Pseudomonas TaxID=196821 RepID=UPI003008D377